MTRWGVGRIRLWQKRADRFPKISALWALITRFWLLGASTAVNKLCHPFCRGGLCGGFEGNRTDSGPEGFSGSITASHSWRACKASLGFDPHVLTTKVSSLHRRSLLFHRIHPKSQNCMKLKKLNIAPPIIAFMFGLALSANTITIGFESSEGYSSTGGTYSNGGLPGQPAGHTKWTSDATNVSNDVYRIVPDFITGSGQMLQTTATNAGSFYAFTATDSDLGGVFDSSSSKN